MGRTRHTHQTSLLIGDVDLSAPSVTTNQPTEQADEDESDVDSDDPYNDNDVRDEE
jgi:hypothetical protein